MTPSLPPIRPVLRCAPRAAAVHLYRVRPPRARRQADRQATRRAGQGAGLAATSEALDGVSLLQRCAAGDQDAFRILYDVHSGRLYGVALRITRQSSLAADAVHDAFLQAWQNAARFDPERGAAETWLLSLVRYRALDLARRRVREVAGADLPEEADPAPGALADLLARDDATALHGCLGELDEDRRSLICLAFMDGLTHSELAERLGAPLGSVKSRIRRGLAALRACLDR